MATPHCVQVNIHLLRHVSCTAASITASSGLDARQLAPPELQMGSMGLCRQVLPASARLSAAAPHCRRAHALPSCAWGITCMAASVAASCARMRASLPARPPKRPQGSFERRGRKLELGSSGAGVRAVPVDVRRELILGGIRVRSLCLHDNGKESSRTVSKLFEYVCHGKFPGFVMRSSRRRTGLRQKAWVMRGARLYAPAAAAACFDMPPPTIFSPIQLQLCPPTCTYVIVA